MRYFIIYNDDFSIHNFAKIEQLFPIMVYFVPPHRGALRRD
jgi:hypothetical protein